MRAYGSSAHVYDDIGGGLSGTFFGPALTKSGNPVRPVASLMIDAASTMRFVIPALASNHVAPGAKL